MNSDPTLSKHETGQAATRKARLTQQQRTDLKHAARKLLVTLPAFALGITFFLPLAWLLSSSLKTPQQIFELPPVWIPKPVMWSNYVRALTAERFDVYFKNTMILAVTTSFGVTISSTLVAYGFSRIEWPGRDAIFFFVLSTMVVPFQVTMIPLYVTFSKIGWVGTYLPLIVPYFTGSTFYIFLLRQFFRTIPQDLTDAAKIDGCSELGIMWRIMLPLARPAIAVVVLFRVLGAWGDFTEPLIYVQKISQFTLSLGLMMFQGMYFTQWELLMAATTAVMLPTLIVFFLAQRTFIEGVTFTGLKGA
jgi:multiple sugar transport system permease protein